MKNYKIHFSEEEREAVLGIVTRSNDVIINQIEPQGVFVTIQLDDDEADMMYSALLAQIDRELRAPKETIVVVEEKFVEVNRETPDA